MGEKKIYDKWASSLLASCRLFQLSAEVIDLQSAFETYTQNNLIDFGLLDEAFQKQVISRVLSSREDADTLAALNPFLSHLDGASSEGLIQANRDIIVNTYNKAHYRKSLLAAYARVIDSHVSHSIDKNTLLLRFLDPGRFSLLKWSDYDESQ